MLIFILACMIITKITHTNFFVLTIAFSDIPHNTLKKLLDYLLHIWQRICFKCRNLQLLFSYDVIQLQLIFRICCFERSQTCANQTHYFCFFPKLWACCSVVLISHVFSQMLCKKNIIILLFFHLIFFFTFFVSGSCNADYWSMLKSVRMNKIS